MTFSIVKNFVIAIVQIIILVLIVLVYSYADKKWGIVLLIITLSLQTCLSGFFLKNMLEAEIATLSEEAVNRAVNAATDQFNKNYL